MPHSNNLKINNLLLFFSYCYFVSIHCNVELVLVSVAMEVLS